MTKLSQYDREANLRLVIEAANNSFPDYPVLADLSACQAILESGLISKPSKLALDANNLFGIKGKGTDGSVVMPTKEFMEGKWISVNAEFAKNKTLEDSFAQHRRLFERGTKSKPDRYLKLFMCLSLVDAAVQVYKSGYATDPNYPTKLYTIYTQYILPRKPKLPALPEPPKKRSFWDWLLGRNKDV